MIVRGLRRVLYAGAMAVVLFGWSALPAQPAYNHRVQFADIAFRPLPHRDGYTQAYSVNFRGNGFYIYAVFLISNIGPKSLNNGVAVLIYRNGESRVFTSEQDFRSFTGATGSLTLKSGPHSLRLEPQHLSKGRLQLNVVAPQFKLNLELDQLQSGVALSGGKVSVSGDARDFVRADVPVAFARARGTMFFDGADHVLNGVGGLDSIYTNTSPHEYAKQFSLTRTYQRESGIFLGVIEGNSNFPDERQARFAYLQNGSLVEGGVIDTVEVLRTAVEPLSGYTLPVETRYLARQANGGECRLHETIERSAGGYSVLGHISTMLRWILRVFFARPFIVHHESTVVLECRTNVDEQFRERARFTRAQTSRYLINE